MAALVALAELLREDPVPGLRVLLVSCGAEETLQDGMRAFLARHRDELEPGRTWFVNLDTVGSPHLVMLEAEGRVDGELRGPWLRDLLAARAERLGIALQRGFRARASTDSVIPSRAGYPTATLVSMTDWRSPANYHLPSDIPANLDYATVADATRLVYELARRSTLAELWRRSGPITSAARSIFAVPRDARGPLQPTWAPSSRTFWCPGCQPATASRPGPPRGRVGCRECCAASRLRQGAGRESRGCARAPVG